MQQMPRDPRALCHSPRKTLMRERFLPRTSDSDWRAGCHMQRRTSYSSYFRFRT
jgi:hypothetical protein